MKAADILAPVWKAIEEQSNPDPLCDLREQRLQQLLEEFEAAERAWFAWVRTNIQLERPDVLCAEPECYSIEEQWPESVGPEPAEAGDLKQKARRYIIARDFEEFREDKWQMIWKLRKL